MQVRWEEGKIYWKPSCRKGAVPSLPDLCAAWLVTVVMGTDELEEDASTSRFDELVISGGGPCNPLSGEVWLLTSELTLFGGDLDDSAREIIIETNNFGSTYYIKDCKKLTVLRNFRASQRHFR